MKRKITIGDVVIQLALLFICFVCLFPFYYVLIVSFADPVVFMNKTIYALPYSFSTSAYRMLIEEGSMLNASAISVFITVAGTAMSMLTSTMAAYGLSKKGAPLRKFFMNMVLITMFFGGQLIPYYIQIKSLGLINNIWVLILPMLVSPFYLIILKNYFLTIPSGLEESAKMDGANDFMVLVRIVVPISLPILASITLFYAVDKWNEWWHAMLFLNDKAKWPMQMMLREILANLASSSLSPMGRMMAARFSNMNPLTAKMAALIMTAVPIIIVYPFLQKYFTKGIMIGSIKE